MNALDALKEVTNELLKINQLIVQLGRSIHISFSFPIPSPEEPPVPPSAVPSIFDVYAQLYAFQGRSLQFSVSDGDSAPCTCATLIQHFLWVLTWSWLYQMCVASGGRFCFLEQSEEEEEALFTVPPCPFLTPKLLDWSQPDAAAVWTDMVHTIQRSWVEVVRDLSMAPSTTHRCEEQQEVLYSLHALVTFGQHYYQFRRLFSVVFSRINVSAPHLSIHMLHTVVKGWVEKNTARMQYVLGVAVEKTVGRELLEVDMLHSLPSTPLRPRNASPLHHHGSPHKEDSQSLWDVAAQRNGLEYVQEVDSRLVYCIMWMVEECDPSSALLRGVSVEGQRICRAHGTKIAAQVLEKFSVANTSNLQSTHSFIPTLSDANKALREITEAYAQLRASLLLLSSGTTHYLKHVTPFGRSIVGKGLEHFLEGFCSHDYALQFMSQWGMELWLQACTTHQRKKLEEATRRTEKKEDAESKGKKGALVQHYLETRGKNGNRTVKSSNSSLVTSNDQVSGYDSTVRTLHPARSRAVSDTAEDPVAQGHVLLNPLGLPLPGTAHSDLRTDDNTAKELRELAILPVDGFVALFHLLPREKCESGAQMQSLFTECVQEYLTQQLHDTLRQEGDKGSTVFPHSVFESCRLALQLTIAVFMDMDDRTELSVMGHVADMAVQAAIQTFFAANAVPAAQTIALALNAHVVEGGTTQDLDALLKLASLLPSRELFVRLYKALVAPRVVSVTSLEEIAADTVVLDKLERVLGTTVAAPCLTLFRDLKQSIKEETPAAVTETTTSVAMLTRLGLTSAPSSQLDNAVGSSFLLRSVRVLCEAWWGPHTPVLLPSHKIKRLFEKSNWFDATFVNAVLRLEWYYRREEDGEAYQPFDAEPPTTASDTKEGPSTSFSTSAMVKDISSAIGSAVNGNRWYGNLRRTERQSGAFGYEDPDEDADFSEAYGGLLPAAGGMNDWRSLSSMGDRHTEQESTVASIPVDGVLEKRRLKWSLTSGVLTFLFYPRAPVSSHGSSKRQSVQVSAPPIVYVLLQFLLREGGEDCTFEHLYNHFPLRVSKPILSHTLKYLVLSKLVCRDAVRNRQGTSVIVYRVEERDLEKVLGTKIVINLAATIASLGDRGALEEDYQPLVTDPAMVAHRKGKATKKGTDTPVRSTKPNRTEELLVETAIVSIMKREQKVSHADLFSMVSERLQKRDFTTTVSLFKNATRNLIEKEFIYREEEEKLYIYMV